MSKIRLLPVVVVAIAALLVLKTLGLVTNGGYVLTGVSVAQAAGAAPAEEASAAAGEHTAEDTSPTLVDSNPTLADPNAASAGSGHGAPVAAEGEHASPEQGEAASVLGGTFCIEPDAEIEADGTVTLNDRPAEAGEGEGHATVGDGEQPAAPVPGSFASGMTNCLPSGDAIPVQIDGRGGSVPLLNTDGSTLSEQQLLEHLAARRTELEKYEQNLALRASIVDAAEKRIEERAATLEALEAQISALVDQRAEMESGQFAGIVAMYETMKPKDAALIFNNLDMDVLLRVAKTMSPRKMAPILAVMDTARAQELTVKMAALADQPATEMTPDDLAALPQIVGQ
ncbi:MotE family protein [Devosia naphthalenivorans]|uniref:MotE family protein n=1 Tax=Devosia naphthalenivorans TaxID=2082392 RepID=UPI000D3AA370|nr:hypothetical protein [Devosia naphthalenivorans]